MVVFNCATFHNLEPSLTIIMDDVGQYFEKKINFMSKIFHSAMCKILIDGWQLMTSINIMGVIIMELHNSWKRSVLIELQWVALYIYNELQFCNSCNLFNSTHNV
jgi:hypothetical protein